MNTLNTHKKDDVCKLASTLTKRVSLGTLDFGRSLCWFFSHRYQNLTVSVTFTWLIDSQFKVMKPPTVSLWPGFKVPRPALVHSLHLCFSNYGFIQNIKKNPALQSKHASLILSIMQVCILQLSERKEITEILY